MIKFLRGALIETLRLWLVLAYAFMIAAAAAFGFLIGVDLYAFTGVI